MSKYNREEILMEGIKLLMENGYAGLGIQHVLKACGIPKGSFYNFFNSKEAFVKEALILYNHIIEKMLKSIENNDKDDYEKIVLFFSLANEQFVSEQGIRSCPMLNTVADHHESVSDLLPLIDQKFQMHKAYLEKWIERGQSLGTIKNNLDAQTLTHLIYDMYHGVIYRGKYQNDPKVSSIFIKETLALMLK